MTDLYEYESQLIKEGHQLIAGIDEAGRGPLAGPLVVALCVLPLECQLEGLRESKQLSAKKREELYDQIIKTALYYNVLEVSVKDIDKLNIYQATKQAMTKLAKKSQSDYVLTDAMPLTEDINHLSIIKGDTKSLSIAAASILAKVTRDRLMVQYHKKYPKYGFNEHKGYATKKHKEALARYGITPIHRTTYKPVSEILEKTK